MIIEQRKYYKKESDPTIGELEELLKNGKVIVRHEQRPFKYNKTQFVEMYEDIVNDFRITPMGFCHVKSSYDRAVEDGNQNDMRYFKEIMDKGYEYTCEDGQHTLTYTMFFNNLYPRLREEARKSKVKLYTFYSVSSHEITKIFSSPNKGRKLRAYDLVWSHITSFNKQVKDLNMELGLYEYSKNKDEAEKIRNSYKTLLKSLMVMLSAEKFDGLNFATGSSALENFVNKDYTLSQMSGIVDCIKTMMVYLNEEDLTNKNEDYTHLNTVFSIHLLKTMGMDIVPSELVEFVNSIDRFPNGKDNSRVGVKDRYKQLEKMFNNGQYKQSGTSQIRVELVETVQV